MIAAIYARKSTEQYRADADDTSVQRQIANARAFAAQHGWQLRDAHVYADDAVSGAETRKLVNRQRLLDALGAGRAPFQILIMRDASRFSRRDGDEAFGELKRIAQSGIAIWFYQDAKQFTFGEFGDNVVGFVRAEMNAEFRRQIGKWTREAMVRKAKAGHVTGGRVFGYDNVRVDGHVERQINPLQADVVRRIFSLSASGVGYTRIAKLLNEESASAPRPQQGRPAGWSPSSVNEVLHRPLYTGQVVWNKTRKRNAAGQTAVAARPEAEWLRQQNESLRIVSDDEWSAAHTRLASRQRFVCGQSVRPGRDIESKYLLSGFARCGTCGGSIGALSRSHGGHRAFFYGCLAHAKRGPKICANALVLPIERVNDAVLARLAGDVLHPAVITAIIDGVFDALNPAAVAGNVSALRAELRALDRRIENLTTAVENGASVTPLIAKLQARQAEREALLTQIGAAEASVQLAVDRKTVRQKVLQQLDSWRELLATNARQTLREVLDGPLRLTPDGKRYHFQAATTTGSLIEGLIGSFTLCGVPNGNRHRRENAVPASAQGGMTLLFRLFFSLAFAKVPDRFLDGLAVDREASGVADRITRGGD
jgi:DNA invertase Pin-like site-specific DNA recombinase